MPDISQCKKVRIGKGSGEICCESSSTQTVLVAVMCKQLYWNWISTFTSGIRLEERQAVDGKALKEQAVLRQVHPQLLCFLFDQEVRFVFLILGHSDTFCAIALVLSFEDRLKVTTL